MSGIEQADLQTPATTSPRRERTCVVMAHFHPLGDLPPHTRTLIDHLSSLAGRFVLVSTCMTDAARASLPACVETIVRENVGYDFYSYRTGIHALGDLSNWDELIIANDSIYVIRPEKLMTTIAGMRRNTFDVWGITSSDQIFPHIQSYLVSFSSRVIRSEEFSRFWNDMKILNEKQEIVRRYEVGLSRLFLEKGWRVGAALTPRLRDVPKMAMIRANRSYRFYLKFLRMLLIPKARRRNPTHFLWERTVDEFGFIKIDLMLSDERKMGLRALRNHMSVAEYAALREAAGAIKIARAAARRATST